MLRFMLRIFCLYVFLLANGHQLVAQEKSKSVYFKQIEYKDGLPTNNIQEAISDQRSGLWFRSDKEVIFYNSNDFLIYHSKAEIFNITNEVVRSFYYQQDKLYVFGSKGVDVISCRSKKAELLFADTLGLDIRGGCVTKNGIVVFVSSKGGIYKLINKSPELIGEINYVYDCTLKVGLDGEVFVSNNAKELLVFSKDLFSYRKLLIPNGGLLAHHSLYEDGEYSILVATQSNIFYYNEHTKNLVVMPDSLPRGSLYGITPKYFYVVNGFNKLQQIDRVNWQKTTMSIPLNTSASYYINHIIVDKNNLGVLSTNQGVILFQEPVSFVTVLPEVNNRPNQDRGTIRALIEREDGKILQFHYKGIDLYDPVKQKNESFLKSEVFSYAAEPAGNDILVGTDGIGLYRLNFATKKFSVTSLINDASQQESYHVTVVRKLNDSLYLVGSSFGKALQLYNNNTDQYQDVVLSNWRSRVLEMKMTDIVVDDFKRIWICTDEGLFLLNSRFEVEGHFDRKSIGEDVVNTVYCSSRNVIWIATASGLLKYDLLVKKIAVKYDFQSGLAGDRCVAILPDKFGTLWVPTFTGLSRIDTGTNKIWNFYIQDGFADNEYNFKAHLITKSGDIYLGGLNGYVKIRPEAPLKSINHSFPLQLDYAVHTSSYSRQIINLGERESITFHSRNDKISFDFSVPDYIYSEYTTYAYKVEGLHKDWILLNRQGKFELSGLPAGKYVLHVQAKDPHGRVLESSYKQELVVYEYWYESRFFKYTVGLLTFITLISIVLLRINSLKKISEIRTELANDIHDEVGSYLTTAVQRLQLLKIKAGSSFPEIESIEKNLRDGLQSFRNVLWSLNTANDKVENLIGRMNQMLDYIFEASGFTYLVFNQTSDLYFNASSHVKRSLLLVLKELATNALKHSNGDFFEVVLRSKGDYWYITIADNGTNQDTVITNNGLGLQSLKKRIAELGGELEFRKEGIGFYVTLKLKK